MKSCPFCGTMCNDEANFCEYCGNNLAENVPNNEKIENPKDSELKEGGDKMNKILSGLKSILYSVMKAVGYFILVAIIFVVCTFWKGGVFFSDLLEKGTSFVKEHTERKTVNITNVILNDRVGIQQLATAQNVYTINRDNTTTQGMLFFDYVTQKYVCDFHYSVKYGYDLSSMKSSDISENKEEKTVRIKLPKGMVISNELLKSNIRHNEGSIYDFNKLQAEDMALLQEGAKKEAAEIAILDEEFIRIAKENVKSAFEKTVHGVAPDYSVVLEYQI